ncbi:MAG: hypothetical protein ACRDOH_12295 [Streptosporangiaceae bacterium]
MSRSASSARAGSAVRRPGSPPRSAAAPRPDDRAAIPVSAVTGVENGIQLNLTKKQVEDLPPAG